MLLAAAWIGLMGCVAGPTGGTRLNLAPLVVYEEEPRTDSTRLELFGPLFRWERAGGESGFTLAPLWDWRQGPDRREAYFLYPLGRYLQTGDATRVNLAPWGTVREELPAGAQAFQFFPVFWGRTAGGEPYGGVFPLYGVFKERFGREEIRFVLWPLFSTSYGEESRHYKILWPFFSYSTGREEALTVWPFYGRIIKAGEYEKYYVLWPFIHRQRLNLDTDRPRTLNAYLPFYLEDSKPGSRLVGYGYPFFSHYTQEEGRYEQWDTPWPLIVRGEGEGFRVRAYRPFYYRREKGGEEETHILWPLYTHLREEEGGSLEVFRRYLALSMYHLRVQAPGDWEEKHRLWPLFYYTGSPGVRQAHAPEVLPLEDPGWARLFGPWVYLWSREEAGGCVRGRALWGLYRWEAGPEYRLWELGFLASRQETATTSTFRLLSGLVTLERRGSTRQVRLLYLPWGMTWEAAGRREGRLKSDNIDANNAATGETADEHGIP